MNKHENLRTNLTLYKELKHIIEYAESHAYDLDELYELLVDNAEYYKAQAERIEEEDNNE